MKTQNFLPLLLIMISLTACVETISRPIHQDAIAPQFTVDSEDLKTKVSAIISAEDILIITGKTNNSGEAEYNFVTVEVINPEKFPSNGFSFAGLAGNIRETVEENVSNIEDYQKMEIVVRHTVEENGTEHDRSFRKEFDL